MTNALTATKTPQLSSQGVPDVILVLNKQEKYEKKRTEQKKNEETRKRKKKRTHKQRHMHTLTHKQRHTHKQKGTCSYTKSILYHCRKNGIQKKMICEIQKKTNGARASRQ
jgi:ABC-type Zn2+ transport system substrate-binding protein/surface adhesin